MPIVFAAVMPHGGALIPDVEEGDANSSPALTATMHEIASAALDAKLDAIVIADPHGISIEGAHSVSVGPWMEGDLGPHHQRAEVDGDLAFEILEGAARSGIPCEGLEASDPSTGLPMQWGTFIPLWFLAQQGPLPPIVAICPSRSYPLEQLALLGEVIALVADTGGRRIGLIASADSAHAHSEDGPYGFHPDARIFDAHIVDLTERELYEQYVSLDPDLMATALPDSPWQLAILAGAARHVAITTSMVTYDCPSYFGMMAALLACGGA